MKTYGATIARVHLQMPFFMLGPDKIDSHGLDQLVQLLKIAQKSGIYLHITGLACYKIKNRMAWYDGMNNAARWKAQVFLGGRCPDLRE